MTHAAALLSIGEPSSRTGLRVRTIRFYSDSGVVPPARRTDAGYRLYGPDALARLELVRTLRDLGIDLATIRRARDGEGRPGPRRGHRARQPGGRRGGGRERTGVRGRA